MTATVGGATLTGMAAEWWRNAVVHQIYPRAFADANGDGIGDLAGVTAHVDHLADLGVDAVWLSPFYPSTRGWVKLSLQGASPPPET